LDEKEKKKETVTTQRQISKSNGRRA
jgi:hypothetical protein